MLFANKLYTQCLFCVFLFYFIFFFKKKKPKGIAIVALYVQYVCNYANNIRLSKIMLCATRKKNKSLFIMWI
jgi:hypothetical protein